MSKHTPGPWRVEYETDISGTENDPENGCVGPVDVAHVYMRTVPGRHEANVRLIAAAPDMLNALRSLLRHAERVNDVLAQECGVRFVDTGPLDMARAAIERATGEAQ